MRDSRAGVKWTLAAASRDGGADADQMDQHLKVLRDSGFATVRAEGTRRPRTT